MRNFVKEERLKRGWSQTHLAELAELSYNTVAFAERGVFMTRKTAKILSRLLKIPLKPIASERGRLYRERLYAARRNKLNDTASNLPSGNPAGSTTLG